MKKSREERLKKVGWRFDNVQDFLNLTEKEMDEVVMYTELAHTEFYRWEDDKLDTT